MLAEFLRRRRNEILTRWERQARTLPGAETLSRPALFDHIPPLLERIAQIADQIRRGETPEVPAQPGQRHALERLKGGFDLKTVVKELSMLRDAVLEIWAEETSDRVATEGAMILNRALDRAIASSIEQYTEAEARILLTLDKISAAALESRNLDDLLRRLLGILREAVSAVDTAAILLLEDGALRMRASFGPDDPQDAPSHAVRIGEGFDGLVAAERRPIHVQADDIPAIPSDPSVPTGLTALFGIPLVHTDGLVGVAHMGSLTVTAFSEQDRYLFTSVARRATHGICQHVLREMAERRAQELSRSERRLRQLVDERSTLLEEARRATRSREEILAIVSHDLRNPLNSIHLATTLLLQNRDNEPRVQRHVETVHRSAVRMSSLIDDLLDLARLESGHLSVDAKPVDAGALVDEALEAQQPLAQSSGIELRARPLSDAHRVVCDRDRMLQVMGNLISNSLKFCRPGDAVTVDAVTIGHELRFDVADSGPGIPEDEVPRVFEPFWSPVRHRRNGTGLGLYISQGIVEAHGGRIWVESHPGAGTTFHFTLPLEHAA